MARNNNIKKEIGWLLKDKYGGKISEAAEKDIERLKKGEPVDYVIGFAKFLSCKIDLSKAPLIPRPETEYWAEKATGEIKNQKLPARNAFGIVDAGGKIRNLRILDIFAGSGCVGIAVLKKIKNAKVDFAEINENFLKQIGLNLKLNGISKNRYKIIKSDVFRNIRGAYDYILANPPYIAADRINRAQSSVLNFEPKEALLGDRDGLFYIKKFLKDAKSHLKPGGKIYLEFDSHQKKAMKTILDKFSYPKCEFYKDQYGKWRYLTIIKS